MYKTETHLHTYPVSACSKLCPEELIRLHKEAGYDTVIISDHFARYHYEKMEAYLGKPLTWEEYVDAFSSGYEMAKRAGEQYGLRVLYSVELTLDVDHFLLYGADRSFLMLRQDIFGLTAAELYAHAKKHGVTVIQAHPLRDEKCTPHPDCVDGFEIFNSHPRHRNHNEEVLAIADQYPQLLRTAGSDVHQSVDVGGTAVLSEEPITSVEDYLALLRSGIAKFLNM